MQKCKNACKFKKAEASSLRKKEERHDIASSSRYICGAREEKCEKSHAVKERGVAQELEMALKATRCGAQESKSDEKVTNLGTGRGIEARECDICPAVRNRQGVEVENCHICPIMWNR